MLTFVAKPSMAIDGVQLGIEELEKENHATHWQIQSSLLALSGRLDASIDCGRKAEQLVKSVFGNDHWRVRSAQQTLSDLQDIKKLSDDQRRSLREAIVEEARVNENSGKSPLLFSTFETISYVAARQPGLIDEVTARGVLSPHVIPLVAAAESLQEVLAKRTEVHGDHHLSVAMTNNELGLICHQQGKLNDAVRFFTEAATELRAIHIDSGPAYVSVQSNLGRVYHDLADWANARRCYERTSSANKNAHQVADLQTVVTKTNFGGLWLTAGDYDAAEKYQRNALATSRELAGESHPLTIQCLINLSATLQANGTLESAGQILDQTIKLTRHQFEQNETLACELSVALNNLAAIRYQQGQLEEADKLLQESLRIIIKRYGPDHLYVAIRLQNLANVACDRDKYLEAEKYCRRALDIRRKNLGDLHPDFAAAQIVLAEILQSQGNTSDAGELYERTIRVAARSCEVAALAQNEREQLQMGAHFRSCLDRFIAFSFANQQQVDLEKVYSSVFSWKGATLIRQRAVRQLASYPEIAELFTELQTLTQQRALLTGAVAADVRNEEPKTQLRNVEDSIDAVTDELNRRGEKYRYETQHFKPEDLAEALSPDDVFVDFFEYNAGGTNAGSGPNRNNRRMAAFILKPGKKLVQLDLGPTDPLRVDIDCWRESFGLSQTSRLAGERLRKSVWEPILPYAEAARTIIVSPDGALGRLPLGALPGKTPDTYLIEEHRFALIPAPQLLPALAKKEESSNLTGDLLLFGDIDYGTSPQQPDEKPSELDRQSTLSGGVQRHQPFKSLNETGGEIAEIRRLFQKVSLGDDPSDAQLLAFIRNTKSLSGSSASESRFRELAPRFSRLHIATHGFFIPTETASSSKTTAELSVAVQGLSLAEHRAPELSNPEWLSGLALAGANLEPEPGEDDGILTAQEIAFLPLNGVETVVLSACETGLGEVAGGEGLIGIQRAFQVAGVRTTVASLWKVDDLVTRRLMERFYRNLWENEMSRLDALREAQLYILNNPASIRGATVEGQQSSKRVPPYYWAAFQLSGDWR
ncbi:CHAT domain-containing protein [Fuerstiella marisgermanici]|uniref:CHAT domain-containing protein n=1 Tax=Fuerstiella marisgermanici TaxID=1891926 RepID=UPI0013142F27|nr:CHAT domain-containing protein [Fuerstiella marisgermanici]